MRLKRRRRALVEVEVVLSDLEEEGAGEVSCRRAFRFREWLWIVSFGFRVQEWERVDSVVEDCAERLVSCESLAGEQEASVGVRLLASRRVLSVEKLVLQVDVRVGAPSCGVLVSLTHCLYVSSLQLVVLHIQ